MANSSPHSHEVVIQYADDPRFRHYFIQYGDTEVMVLKSRFWRKRRLRWGIQEAIERHDQGSMWTPAPRTDPGRDAAEVLASLPTLAPDKWASEGEVSE